MDVTGAYTEVFIRWLDCIDRGVPPTDPRRRIGQHGLHLRRRHRPGQHPGDGVGPRGRRLQRRQRHGDLAAGPLAGDPAGRRAPTTWARSSTRRARSTRSLGGWPTSRRAREELGFEAEVSLEDGLRRLREWQRERSTAARRCWFHDDTTPRADDPDRQADPGRGRSRRRPAGDPLRLGDAGPAGQGIRGGVRRLRRCPPRLRRLQLHDGAAPGAARPGRRAGRRGDHGQPFVHRHGQRGPLLRGACRSSWTSTRAPTTSTRP